MSFKYQQGDVVETIPEYYEMQVGLYKRNAFEIKKPYISVLGFKCYEAEATSIYGLKVTNFITETSILKKLDK